MLECRQLASTKPSDAAEMLTEGAEVMLGENRELEAVEYMRRASTHYLQDKRCVAESARMPATQLFTCCHAASWSVHAV
jgi:hypothetical protein